MHKETDNYWICWSFGFIVARCAYYDSLDSTLLVGRSDSTNELSLSKDQKGKAFTLDKCVVSQ